MKSIFVCLMVIAGRLYGDFSPALDPVPIHEAFITPVTDVLLPKIVGSEPPSPIIEKVPPQPASDVVWIKGYWHWLENKNQYVWICGVWRRVPPGKVWIEGNWLVSGGGWAWSQGFWSDTPQINISYIPNPPPQQPYEEVPQSPGPNYFWAPGYWQFSNGNYGWLGGKWELFNPNWILSPACYVWSPSGFVFRPMYWDHPLEKRGFAYNCFDQKTYVEIKPDFIVQQLFICYPNYLHCYWHWWHFHPDWFQGCGCLPPWWGWDGWWTFPWGDSWGLWWWWGHPGFFPPFWLSLDLSLKIAPPSQDWLDKFSKFKKPDFKFKAGDKDLLPKGPKDLKNVPKPNIPADVKNAGKIDIPNIKDGVITPPPPPPAPQGNITPAPQPYNPPEVENPTIIYPPSGGYYPPQNEGRPHYPRYPKWDDDDHKRPKWNDDDHRPNYPKGDDDDHKKPKWNDDDHRPNYPKGDDDRHPNYPKEQNDNQPKGRGPSGRFPQGSGTDGNFKFDTGSQNQKYQRQKDD